jgi:hypothetical protein
VGEIQRGADRALDERVVEGQGAAEQPQVRRRDEALEDVRGVDALAELAALGRSGGNVAQADDAGAVRGRGRAP